MSLRSNAVARFFPLNRMTAINMNAMPRMQANQSDTTTALLPHSRRRLVEIMQQISFGRIEGLIVRDGEPVFEPPPRIIRDVKLGAEADAPRGFRGDFALKNQVVDLFEYLTRTQNGTIECIEVKHGLPFRLLVEHPA
jgi:hypothetical protein